MRASAVEIRPLRHASTLAAVALGVVLLAVLVADVDGVVRAALLVAVAACIVGAVPVLRRAAAPHRFEWDARGGWRWDGRTVAVLPSTRVYAGLVVLVLRETTGGVGKSRAPTAAHWVPRGTVEPDAFRRLKGVLRLAARPRRDEDAPC